MKRTGKLQILHTIFVDEPRTALRGASERSLSVKVTWSI